MINRKRKGFTIVELVIVIAIIAILAAVLVPTFASIIRKANESADIQAVRQMNTALAAKSVETKPGTIAEVILILKEAGYNAADKLVPVSSKHGFYWCSTANMITLIKDEGVDDDPELIFPTDYETLNTAFEGAKDTTTNNNYAINFGDDKDKTELDSQRTFFDLEASRKILEYTDEENAIVTGKDFVLSADTKITNALTVPAGKRATITIPEGATLTLEAPILVKGTLVINGGSISATGKGGLEVISGGVLSINGTNISAGEGATAIKNNGGTVTLDDADVSAETGATGIDNSGTLNVNCTLGSTLAAEPSFNLTGNDSTLTVSGSKSHGIKNNNGGTANLANVSVSASDGAYGIYNDGGAVHVNGVNVTGNATGICNATGSMKFLGENTVTNSGITLLGSVSIAESGSLDISVSVVVLADGINISGNLTITDATISTAAAPLEYVINNSGISNLTFTNCTFTNGTDSLKADVSKDGITLTGASTVSSGTVSKDVTINIGSNSISLSGITVNSEKKLTVSGSGAVTMSGFDGKGSVEISGANITNITDVAGIINTAVGKGITYTECTFTDGTTTVTASVSGNEITLGAKGATLSGTVNGGKTVNITGGKLTISGAVTVNSGTLKLTGNVAVNANSKETGDGTLEISEASISTSDNALAYVISNLIGKGITYTECTFTYGTTTVNASVSGNEITLGSAATLRGTVALSKGITLNLGGKELTWGSAVTVKGGTLAITGDGVISGDVSALNNIIAASTLTMEECTFKFNMLSGAVSITKNAETGTTVKLEAGSIAFEGLKISSKVTIDLNGYDVDLRPDYMKLTSTADLTITDSSNGDGLLYTNDEDPFTNGTTHLENIRIKVWSNSYANTVLCYFLENNTITATNCNMVLRDTYACLAILNQTQKVSTVILYVELSGNLTVDSFKETTINANGNKVSSSITNNGTLNISNATVSGKITNNGTLNLDGVTISGKTLSGKINFKNSIINDATEALLKDLISGNANYTFENSTLKYSYISAVFNGNSVEMTASNSGTLTLPYTIPSGKNVTFNLNNKTITLSANASFAVNDGGTLNINGGTLSVSGASLFAGSGNVSLSGVTINAGGETNAAVVLSSFIANDKVAIANNSRLKGGYSLDVILSKTGTETTLTLDKEGTTFGYFYVMDITVPEGKTLTIDTAGKALKLEGYKVLTFDVAGSLNFVGSGTVDIYNTSKVFFNRSGNGKIVFGTAGETGETLNITLPYGTDAMAYLIEKISGGGFSFVNCLVGGSVTVIDGAFSLSNDYEMPEAEISGDLEINVPEDITLTISNVLSGTGSISISGGGNVETEGDVFALEGSVTLSGVTVETFNIALLNGLIAKSNATITNCTFGGATLNKTGTQTTIVLKEGHKYSFSSSGSSSKILTVPAGNTVTIDLGGQTLNMSGTCTEISGVLNIIDTAETKGTLNISTNVNLIGTGNGSLGVAGNLIIGNGVTVSCSEGFMWALATDSRATIDGTCTVKYSGSLQSNTVYSEATLEKSGDVATITLQANTVAFSDNRTIPTGKTVNIALNGKTLALHTDITITVDGIFNITGSGKYSPRGGSGFKVKSDSTNRLTIASTVTVEATGSMAAYVIKNVNSVAGYKFTTDGTNYITTSTVDGVVVVNMNSDAILSGTSNISLTSPVRVLMNGHNFGFADNGSSLTVSGSTLTILGGEGSTMSSTVMLSLHGAITIENVSIDFGTNNPLLYFDFNDDYIHKSVKYVDCTIAGGGYTISGGTITNGTISNATITCTDSSISSLVSDIEYFAGNGYYNNHYKLTNCTIVGSDGSTTLTYDPT